MNETTAQVLNNLYYHLGNERYDLGEVIVDVCDGANIRNLETKELLKKLFASMPNSDSLTTEDIAKHIREVGTPYAETIAQDILSAE